MTERRIRTTVMVVTVTAVLCTGCATLPSTPAVPAPPTSAAAGATTIVAVAPPASPQFTLPKFLGLDLLFGGARRLGLRVRNRLGSRFPGLEPKPPIKSITDPANMGPDASPAEKAAAEAKMEEDKAPQKAKAIRYLASRGCGECYPDTADALIAALDDCSEVIRYETVRGLRGSAGGQCQCCRENSCCTPELLKKLYEIAYERDDSGCFVESSARVRRNARLVICACGGVPSMPIDSLPIEGPPMEAIEPSDLPPPVQATANAAPSEGDAEDIVVSETGTRSDSVRPVGNLDDDTAESAVETAILETGSDQRESKRATTAGFVLPDSFQLPPDSGQISGTRE